MITVDKLKAFEGLNISKICDGEYTDNGLNHCAHFVSHALGLSIGFTCRGMTGKGTSPASIRVHEVFARCTRVAEWDENSGETIGLAFVTATGNVDLKTKVMKNVPKKHVGILLAGTIWHYSNTNDKVVTTTPAVFAKHYAGKDIGLFFGSIPA